MKVSVQEVTRSGLGVTASATLDAWADVDERTVEGVRGQVDDVVELGPE